ncbi:peptidoglycan DD-metalloendopeptidase family protein [Lysobacter sp. GX 14042]|uniref:M23 family metallopeptidase n=1 Tax=Lysobacter sp. GX 14042 TaxID=2907155 RepID=UPI001F1CF71C|nr:peptidoglycan DD-metalloendopeptidase family protein [Lysobacter sp. GX 14042]MCE7032219.1 peptidoglycan DD-metalloendopeptidase family protein [Lysobacter sp. GX 14042]
MAALTAAIVPGFGDLSPSHAHVPLQSTVLPLPPMPAREDTAPAELWQTVEVRKGQTLGELFQQMGVPATTMHRILEQPGAEQALTRLRPGAELGFEIGAEGELLGFRYQRDRDNRVEVSLADGAVKQRTIELPREIRSRVVTGEIGTSLYAAARKAGLSPASIATMTDEIFQYDIDFTTSQKGDRFSVVYDEVWRDGERIGSGEIQAATFSTGGKTYTGLRFEHDGQAGYFDAEGRPLKKAFIRMPIPYARVTSGFTSARKHPVLGKTRAHRGVDYGARPGTPIMAAGDARVTFVGWQNGYGRTVILDHGKGHTTLYAHMSRFGNFKRGQRVKQGQTIGFVGASGLATGPHLHYEFRVNGVHKNPLAVTLPPPEPLKGSALVAFRAATAPALARLQQADDRARRAAAMAATAPADSAPKA